MVQAISSSSWRARAARWVAIGGVLVWAAQALLAFPRWSPDDAYILLRYVENFARHGDLTWNVGEPPVEGYTGVLLPFTLAIAIKVGGSAYVAAKALGVTAFALGALILARLLRLLRVRPDVTFVAVAAYATAPEGYVQALSGLETTLFATLVGASVLALANAIEHPSRRADWVAAGVALAVSLTRPEGVVCALVSLGGIALARRRSATGAGPSLRTFTVAYVAPGAAYFVWRWHHYGRLLPNTFYAKFGAVVVGPDLGPSLAGFVDGYLGGLVGGALAAAAVLVIVAPAVALDRARRRAGEALAFVLLVGPPLAVYARSHLAMDYHHRFCFHDVVPFLAVVAVVASDAVDGLLSVGDASRARVRTALGLSIAFALAQGLTNVHRLGAVEAWARNYRALNEHEHMLAGDWLREHLPARARVASFADAGLVGYRSMLPVVDFGRLSDAYLARPGLTQQDVVDYFFASDVAALVVTSFSSTRVEYTPDAVAITRDPRFAAYRLARVFSTTDPPVPDCEMVFVRADLPERGAP